MVLQVHLADDQSLGVKIRNGRDDIIRRILLEQEKATVPASSMYPCLASAYVAVRYTTNGQGCC